MSLSHKDSLIVSCVITVHTLRKIVGTVVRKKREVRNCWGIVGGIVCVYCKDDFVNK